MVIFELLIESSQASKKEEQSNFYPHRKKDLKEGFWCSNLIVGEEMEEEEDAVDKVGRDMV